MNNIKSFVYLDSYKMYSISSQIFEGLTEYIVMSKSKSIEETTKQKGELFSGRFLADIIGNYDNHTEKKFLHDYSYNLFENKLFENGKVLEINSKNVSENINLLDDYNFVKITGKVVFNDAKIIEETLKAFNQLGEAFGTITLHNQKVEIDKESKELIDKIKERNQKVKVAQQIQANVNKNFKSYLKEIGLNLDQKYLDSLNYIINYGYKGRFEIQMPFLENGVDVFFSGLLNRSFLTEDEYSIINKYSRETEKEFSIFGLITQTNNREKNEKQSSSTEKVEMKRAIMTIVSALANVEQTFVGKIDNEYIIDPIAVYREI